MTKDKPRSYKKTEVNFSLVNNRLYIHALKKLLDRYPIGKKDLFDPERRSIPFKTVK